MAFNIFATATSDIPLANLDANFTMIGSSGVASTLYPTATTSITYGTTGTIHYFSGSGLAVTGTLSATGKAGIGRVESATTGLIVRGLGTTSATRGFVVENSSGTEILIQDDAGNLGLGFTPSAWNSNVKAIEMPNGRNGALYADSGYYGAFGLVTNAVWDSGGANSWTYKTTNAALRYEQNGIAGAGTHVWWNAPSGTLNTAITWTQAMTLDASGNLLVGQTSPSQTTLGFGVSGSGGTYPAGTVSTVMAGSTSAITTWNTYSTGAAAYRFYVDMGGTVHATSIVITAISDKRLKENVRDIDTGLDAIMALKPRRFDWKEGKGQDKKNAAGFIAQEFENVFPECVSTSKAGGDGIEYKNINHETLIPTLVKAIQEQQAIITALTTRITALEAK